MADASDDCRVFPTYRSSCRRFPTYLGRGRDDDDETHTKSGRDALLGRSVLGREASAGHLKRPAPFTQSYNTRCMLGHLVKYGLLMRQQGNSLLLR